MGMGKETARDMGFHGVYLVFCSASPGKKLVTKIFLSVTHASEIKGNCLQAVKVRDNSLIATCYSKRFGSNNHSGEPRIR